MKGKYLLFLLSAVLFFSSCKVDVSTDQLEWRPDILAPIIKTEATIIEIADINNKEFVQEISTGDIGQTPGVPVVVPPLYIAEVGPYSFELSEYLVSVYADSIALGIRFENNFPIPISAGTKIVFRSSSSTTSPSNIVYTHTVASEIPANGTYVFDVIIEDRTVPSELYLYLEDFESPGGSGTFTGDPSRLTLTFKYLSVGLIILKTNQEIALSDTSDFSFGDETGLDNDAAEGELILYFENEIPINTHFQAYFLNSLEQVIDSLFDTPVMLSGASTDAQGNAIALIEDSYTIAINETKLTRLQTAEHIAMQLISDTNGFSGTEVNTNGDSNFGFQLVADLTIKVAIDNE